MSELINNSTERIKKLKELLLKLHDGNDVESAKAEIVKLFGSVPYGEVVQAEQELIAEGLPASEIQKYCDLHSGALKDNIDLTFAKDVPEGHPVHTLKLENRALESELNKLKEIFIRVQFNRDSVDPPVEFVKVRAILNNLMDIEKHYVKKENVIFPYLEKYGITGPSTVMWGKDDEVRGLLKSCVAVYTPGAKPDYNAFASYVENLFKPAASAIQEMIDKEEKILFPMCLDRLTDIDWYAVLGQCNEIGYCLVSSVKVWRPEGVREVKLESGTSKGKVKLSNGSFTVAELEAMLNSIPVDLTFVDKDDTVKFFSHGSGRIFDRNKAILGRKVQYCHPPSSVHMVEKILDDFKSGAQNAAKFWINYKGKFVHIAYFAVRGNDGEYLGTVEVTQDINEYKNTEGERRLLTYDEDNKPFPDTDENTRFNGVSNLSNDAVTRDNIIDGNKNSSHAPVWISKGTVVREYDAAEDLAKGIHPAGMVISEAGKLKENEIFVMTTGFMPAPLLDMLKSQGFDAFSQQVPDGKYRTYIRKI